jgi:hypothetical protein
MQRRCSALYNYGVLPYLSALHGYFELYDVSCITKGGIGVKRTAS